MRISARLRAHRWRHRPGADSPPAPVAKGFLRVSFGVAAQVLDGRRGLASAAERPRVRRGCSRSATPQQPATRSLSRLGQESDCSLSDRFWFMMLSETCLEFDMKHNLLIEYRTFSIARRESLRSLSISFFSAHFARVAPPSRGVRHASLGGRKGELLKVRKRIGLPVETYSFTIQLHSNWPKWQA